MNNDLLDELKNISKELKCLNAWNENIYNQNTKIINKLDKIHSNTSFIVFTIWLIIIFVFLLLILNLSSGGGLISEFVQIF